jgi:hypothetical protein
MLLTFDVQEFLYILFTYRRRAALTTKNDSLVFCDLKLTLLVLEHFTQKLQIRIDSV